MDPCSRPSDNPPRYKNLFFAAFLVLWLGPLTMVLTTGVSTFLYGSENTLPWLKKFGLELYWELVELLAWASSSSSSSASASPAFSSSASSVSSASFLAAFSAQQRGQ